MKHISSSRNPEIKLIIKLFESKERRRQGLFLAEGSRTCSTLTQSAVPLQRVYVIEEKVKEVLEWAPEEIITTITPAVLKKISQATTPSGIIATFHIPKNNSPIGPGIVLAQMADPGNMGTLIRTAAALAKKTVVVIDGVDPWNIKVVQASAGTIGMVNMHSLSWPALMQKKGKLPLAALVVKSGIDPKAANLTQSLLVVGNEAHGLPDAWLGDCDYKITLLMPGNTESLNAAVAGSIALYLATAA